MTTDELVEVYVLRNPGRLAALKLLLETERLPHFIEGENQAALPGALQIRVLAPATDAERVRQFIMDHEP